MHLPRAPTTQFVPHPVGKMEVEHVKMPPTYPHSGPVGLFGDDATIPLVKPSGRDLHPRMPVVGKVQEIHIPVPPAPKNLQKGLKAASTRIPPGAIPLEKHMKEKIPLPFRG